MAKDPNKVPVMKPERLLEKQMAEEQEKTQFVGESTEFGKEVNRRLTERGISIYEQIGIIRKALKIMGCTYPEFVAFDALVEEIKAEIEEEQENEHPGE